MPSKNHTQTNRAETSQTPAAVHKQSEGEMVMGDWKAWVGLNGELVNNSDRPVTVWSGDRGTYTIAAHSRSASWGEDVDHVQDVHGQWWKIGWNTAVVDANGEVSGAECRTLGRGWDCSDPAPDTTRVRTKLEDNRSGNLVAETETDQPGPLVQRVCSACGEDRIQREEDAPVPSPDAEPEESVDLFPPSTFHLPPLGSGTFLGPEFQLGDPDSQIDWFGMSRPYINRAIPYRRFGDEEAIRMRWLDTFHLAQQLGFNADRSSWISNQLTPMAIDSALSGDFPTTFELMNREMNVSPTMINAPAVHFKLEVGQPNDAFEQEADAVADQVMRMPEPFVQRKCTECEEEEKARMKPLITSMPSTSHTVNRKSSHWLQKQEGTAAAPVEAAIQSKRGAGKPMPDATRSFMETRMGADFGGVNIHSDSQAAELNKSLGAKAFTIGSDIFFNKGQWNPESSGGKNLLAHELTHVVQQGRAQRKIQRACDPAEQTQYDQRAQEIRQLPLFVNVPSHGNAINTPAETRTLAGQIITQARNRDNCLYYINKLHLLFSTPEAPSSSTASRWGPVLSGAAAAEQQRLQDPQAQSQEQFEENISGASGRSWRQLTGQGGKIYYVDDSNITNIVVKVKVRLRGVGSQASQLVSQARQLEDGIEKEASKLGYTIDLQFVNRSGRDVFEATVDPSQWPTSGNWVGSVRVMAHELHHLLGLRDRYNYIESHAANQDMFIANRIHWFNVEFNRAPDPNINRSIMGRGSLVLDEDICTVTQPANRQSCITQRQSLRTSAVRAKGRANGVVHRLIETLSNVRPYMGRDPRLEQMRRNHVRRRMVREATRIFGQPVSEEAIHNALDRIRYYLIHAEVYMENTSAPRCLNEDIGIRFNPVTFVICPTFTNRNNDDQQRLLTTTAYRIYQQRSGRALAAARLGSPLDPTIARNWGRFIARVQGLS